MARHPNEVGEQEMRDEASFIWKIPNWKEVQMNLNQIKALRHRVPVTFSSGNVITWELSFRSFEPEVAMVQMKLVQYKKMYYPGIVELCSQEMEVNQRVGKTTVNVVVTVEPGKWFDTNLKLPITYFVDDDDGWDINGYTNSQNELVLLFKMKMQFKIIEECGMEKFSKAAFDRTLNNLEVLLTMQSFQNAKIITNDDKEFHVNKFLLSSRCSVFESMFRSGMQEASTNTVKVPDVNGDVMEILIRFWYTGKLADNWSHPDIIEDFTYAAGKYRIEEILELLDDNLGFENKIMSTIQLLDLARKLGLQKAEKRMVKSIGRRAAAAETSEQIFALFNCSCSKTTQKQLPEGPTGMSPTDC